MIGDNPILIIIGVLMLIFAYLLRDLQGGEGAIIVFIGLVGIAFISPVLFQIVVVFWAIYELMK